MNTTQQAVFAGGCFWCTEALLKSLKGVVAIMPGYTGGQVENPTYLQVCDGNTGHAEAVQIDFDPSVITYGELLSVFFNTHDPTTLNRQGNDVGTQYRSAIFYTSEEQKKEAEALIKELNDSKAYDKPVVTEVVPLTTFYPAETYHQDYYAKNQDKGYCQLIIAPKLEKLQEKYHEILKKSEE
jgi:peptide-methionine (S)-S-oxide reductase